MPNVRRDIKQTPFLRSKDRENSGWSGAIVKKHFRLLNPKKQTLVQCLTCGDIKTLNLGVCSV